MKIKNILKNFAFAGMFIVGALGAAYAQPGQIVDLGAVCHLVTSLQEVFKILRTLAFVGAAFIIMGWGWSWITAPEFKLDDAKKKGTAMLVGFILLFAVGAVLQFLISATGQQTLGCVAIGW